MDASHYQHQSRQNLAPPVTDQPPTESYHKVYILSCAHCNSFVTDRGMRAVLLLRPSITLFSTDGMPYNCGPLYPDANDELGYAEQVERTCNCLTQSLGCFGCGNTIGYHIICPCSRCVDSVSKHRRAANGHRWVFHYGEVTFKERTYVTNEPGVYQPTLTSSTSIPRLGRHIRQTSFLSISADHPDLIDDRDQELAKPEPVYQHEAESSHELIYDSELRFPSNPFPSRHQPPRLASSHRDLLLKEGEPVYWHQLINAGERALPVFPRPNAFKSRPAR
ncbi:hypothetical protein CROQUDRAFT_673941 [Cronartium quercuum f. sp. fusiforme G11]|uniref:Uncharacterized protein n=1 Tax=Cronartium quercuum f. sp. fusiforme G11 TaxID=708437 RepID=A0A9P6T7M8_9BASI|nr:hypothetical protein CROQUDRAFT_673941 [Cronartium quercuum f. sp. fusiforme G11]